MYCDKYVCVSAYSRNLWTEPRLQSIYPINTKKLAKFGRLVSEIREWTDITVLRIHTEGDVDISHILFK